MIATRFTLKCIEAFCVCIVVAVSQSLSADANAQMIQWQVDNPFRFYRYQSDFEIQRWAYRELSDTDRRDNPVSKIERKLNHPQWWETRHPSGRTYSEELASARKSEGREPFQHDPRLGWGSLLRPGRYDTCWRANLQTHRDCTSTMIDERGGKYLDPKAHRITIWKDGGRADETCRWSASQPVFPASSTILTAGAARPCSERIAAVVPSKTKIELLLNSGTGQSREDIEVRDMLIVGLGDSFSSGEGNPDVPVPIDPSNGIAPGYDELESRTYKRSIAIPRRLSPSVPAQWLDRKCHRSIYSWQARTALALSLKTPQHQAVTFLSLACSGAEILEGMLYPYKGRETLDTARMRGSGSERLHWSQLDAIVDELCMEKSGEPALIAPAAALHDKDEWVVQHRVRKNAVAVRTCPKDKMRTIDLLLISIGGNDIGFSRLIADTVLQNDFSVGCVGILCYPRSLIRKIGKVVSVTESENGNPSATIRLQDHLPPRFAFLKEAFAQRLKLADNDSKRIVFVAYPSPLLKIQQIPPQDNLCSSGRDSMSVSEIFEIKSIGSIRKVYDFVEDRLIPDLKRITSEWTWIDQHRSLFHGHGFCSSSPNGPNESGKNSAEKLGIAYTTFSPTDPWKIYDPRNFYPYESRSRWFRTFNDDYVITNYAKRRFVIESFGRDESGRGAAYAHPANLIEQTLGGPMHPTAEGHSHMADAVAKKAIDLLKLGD